MTAKPHHHHHSHRHHKPAQLRRRGIALLREKRDGREINLVRRFLPIALVPTTLIVVGTAGYLALEPETTFLDALYMTVITLTTVGYGEFPNPLSPAGRVFTMFLLLGGVFTLFWAAGEMIRTIVSGEVQGVLERRRMERDLRELDHHYIVCGFGRMGQRVCREFSQQGIPFVVLERNQHLLEGFNVPHGIALQGDAAADELLKRAGVDKARALVTVLGSDADNLFITMSARLLNEHLLIVARCEEEQTQQKLIRAGADRVISPYAIGGSRVAQAVLRPSVVDFLDLATQSEHFEIQLEETLVEPKSSLDGMSIIASSLSKNYGIFIVAVKRENGQMVYNPPADFVMRAGDILIALGHRDQLEHLDKLAVR